MASDRNSQVARVITVFNLLSTNHQGLTVKELHEKVLDRGHECEERTVRRDLDALERAGFPLEAHEAEGVRRWRIPKNTRLGEHLVLNSAELFALYLAKGFLAPLKDTVFHRELEQVFQKIEEKLGARAESFFKELDQDIYFDSQPKWGLGISPEVLDVVRFACVERQVLSVVYDSATGGTKRRRRMGPQFLYFAKGSLYLVAEDLEGGGVKVFAVPRMSEPEALDEEYSGKPVDPEKLFLSSFGIYQGLDPVRVTLDFAPGLSAYLRERSWHSSQRLEILEDGKVRMQLDVAIAPDLVQWVLGFGQDVVVLEPSALRDQVVESAKAILKAYSARKVA